MQGRRPRAIHMVGTSPAGQIYLTTMKIRPEPGCGYVYTLHRAISANVRVRTRVCPGPGWYYRYAEHTSVPAGTRKNPHQSGKHRLPPPSTSVSSFPRTAGSTGRFDRPLEEYLAAIPAASIAWIDYSTKDDAQEIEQLAQAAGFSKLPIPKLSTGFYSAYEDYDTELGIMLPSVTIKNDTMTVHPLFVLIRENFILTVHSEDINRLLRFSRYAQPFFKRISSMCTCDKITLMLERIIDENNDRNFEYLREIEAHGDAISKSLIEEKVAKNTLPTRSTR